MRRIGAACAGFLFLSLGVTAAVAETPQRAGRLSYVEGSVSVRVQGDRGWAPAQLNLPVTTGTALWTEPAARAEVEIGSVTLRVDSETELDVTRLDDRAIEIAVPEGTVNVHRGASPDSAIWVATPDGPVILSRPGFYRIADGAVTPVDANPSPFDRWAMAREDARAQAQAETLRYVSPETTGYRDLAANGSWTVTPTYGAVWYPRAIPVGWAPYRYGHWAYVVPWGWTWIDNARWGFAPFHYGSWVQVHGRWGWSPGRVVRRPVFVPARVVFVGGGHDRHAPPRRWIPLAPHETVPRVAVNVHVDVNRFANRAAVSSLPRATVARQARRGKAPGPHPRAHDRRSAGAHEERQAVATPRVETPRPAVHAPAPKAKPQPQVQVKRPRPHPAPRSKAREQPRPQVQHQAPAKPAPQAKHRASRPRPHDAAAHAPQAQRPQPRHAPRVQPQHAQPAPRARQQRAPPPKPQEARQGRRNAAPKS